MEQYSYAEHNRTRVDHVSRRLAVVSMPNVVVMLLSQMVAFDEYSVYGTSHVQEGNPRDTKTLRTEKSVAFGILVLYLKGCLGIPPLPHLLFLQHLQPLCIILYPFLTVLYL